ncbi:MAG: hypothetical protein OXG46_12835 [Chloroflexi bacterium]|nr:hypothetical protein [Chloroflexota bacterium]MCY3938842.1 hypothetical protein [Chloroflexota bacterium]
MANGVYVPIEIEELPGGVLQGYSAALSLNLRLEDGELVFHDPATDRPIASLESVRGVAQAEREARLAAEARADTLQARADTEREGRLQERQAREAAAFQIENMPFQSLHHGRMRAHKKRIRHDQ